MKKHEPTLADFVHMAVGKSLDDAMSGGISALATRINEAQRFVFSETALTACEKLSKSRPSSLLEATKFCRIPFQTTWFEWSTGNDTRTLKMDHWNPELDVEAPVRMGFLAECLDETYRRFGLTLVWAHSPSSSLFAKALRQENGATAKDVRAKIGYPVEISSIGYVINWDRDWPLTINPPAEPIPRGSYTKFSTNKTEMEAMRQLNRNRIPTFTPYTEKFCETVRKANHSQFDRMMKASSQDWEGEYQKIIAIICMMNSRNCVSTEKVELSKFNKARNAGNKKPFLSYSSVEINLSRNDARRAESANASPSEIRQHIVMGHFKVRKGGVFWWNPFLRGDATLGEVRRTHYSVVSK
jgi:hypothetical protein